MDNAERFRQECNSVNTYLTRELPGFRRREGESSEIDEALNALDVYHHIITAAKYETDERLLKKQAILVLTMTDEIEKYMDILAK